MSKKKTSPEKNGKEKKEKRESRRHFLKSCSGWLAGNFVLLNGGVFSLKRRSVGQDEDEDADLECAIENPDGTFTTDADCGIPFTLPSGETSITKDMDCGLPTTAGPDEGMYEHGDADCGSIVPPVFIPGQTKWHIDSDCAITADPTGVTHTDDDEHIVPQMMPSSDCGVEEGSTGFYYEDKDCAKGTPVKKDVACGKPARNQPVWPGNVGYDDKDCGILRGGTVRHWDSNCGLSAWGGGSTRDYDCGKLSRGTTLHDNDCGKPVKAGIGHWTDQDCNKAKKGGGTWSDNYCDDAWYNDIDLWPFW